MSTFCLLPNKVDAFKKALKDKDIKISDLLGMSSEARTKLLEKYAGKNAKDVNLLFEKKLVLKNKALGIKNWASKVGEIGRYDKSKKAELAKMAEDYKKIQEERIFNPTEEQTFLNELADQAIGTHITRVEAKNIFELSNKAEELKSKFNEETGEWKSTEAKIEYGSNKVLLERYIESLKDGEKNIKDLILERYYEGKQTFKENKAKAVKELVIDTLKTISDNSIAFVASVDNSFIGRQGINTLKTRPSVWYNVAKNSFKDFYKTLKDKQGENIAKDSLMAEVFSNENYLNGNYDLAKLIPKSEEQFPATLPEKIPGLGRVFKASEASFTNSAIRARTKTFDVLHDLAKENGVEMNKAQVQDIGRLVNSLTARGDLGRAGDGGLVRLVMWAPKMLKANWDVLTGHTAGAGLETAFAKKQAKINLLKVVSTTATVIAIANAISPGSAETDPTSTDFGKIKVGNTRFDVTGGAGSLITLISRFISGDSKSSVTKIKTELNSGDFGSRTKFDVGMDFLANKTTPFSKAIIDYAKGRDFEGKKPTAGSTTFKISTPISVQNFVDNFYKEGNALTKDIINNVAAVIGSIADLVGIGANTYSIREDWELKDTKEINQFKSEVDKETFKKANKEYNEIIDKEINETIKSDEYLKLSEKDKQKTIEKIKKDAKKEIFKKY